MRINATTKDPAKTVRFPGELLQKIKEGAAASGRSENSEIVFRVALGLGLVQSEGPSSTNAKR